MNKMMSKGRGVNNRKKYQDESSKSTSLKEKRRKRPVKRRKTLSRNRSKRELKSLALNKSEMRNKRRQPP